MDLGGRIPQLLLHCQAIDAIAVDHRGLASYGEVAELAKYESKLFDPTNPRYVTMKAMCGLPIRFVASTPQSNPQLWVVFKS